MYCKKCGAELKPGAQFCSKCGTTIVSKSVNSRNSASNDFKQTIQKAVNVYTSNWKRIGDGQWSGESLKHHLVWIGVHAAVLIVLLVLILPSGGGSASYPRYDKAAQEREPSTYADSPKGDTSFDIGYSKEDIESAVSTVGAAVDYYTKVLFSSLEGTWTDSKGTFTMTIGNDGKVRIADSTGTLGADLFTWTEVDDDTVRLKADSDNPLSSILSIDMDYQVDGETLTIGFLGKNIQLTRKKSFFN